MGPSIYRAVAGMSRLIRQTPGNLNKFKRKHLILQEAKHEELYKKNMKSQCPACFSSQHFYNEKRKNLNMDLAKHCDVTIVRV